MKIKTHQEEAGCTQQMSVIYTYIRSITQKLTDFLVMSELGPEPERDSLSCNKSNKTMAGA